jgi:hypothetical protein
MIDVPLCAIAAVSSSLRVDSLDSIRSEFQAISDTQLSIDILDRWGLLIEPIDGDELTVGGQSVREIERIKEFEKFVLSLSQTEFHTEHHFSDGIYMRELWVPKDSILIGYEHKHECLNLMLAGKVLTITNGVVSEFTAPWRGKSGAHTKKASIVVEDMIWTTVHPNPTNETDIPTLEQMLYVKDAQ